MWNIIKLDIFLLIVNYSEKLAMIITIKNYQFLSSFIFTNIIFIYTNNKVLY